MTGDIVTIACPAGKRLRLTTLYADNISFDKAGTSVTFGSRTVVNSKTLTAADTGNDNEFQVGLSTAASAELNGGLIGPITGRTNENLVINISVSSSGDIVYSYEEGI